MASFLRDDDGVVNPGNNTHLTELVERALANPNRRMVLRSGVGLAALSIFGGALSACGSDDGNPVAPAPGTIGIKSVPTSSDDVIVLPAGYVAQAILPWGAPLLAGAPDFIGDASESWPEQEQQVGDNHDGINFFAFKDANGKERSDAGLLAMNHEYINPEYFYAPGNDPGDWMEPWSFDKAKKGQAAHGVTIVEVRRKSDGSWEYVQGSPYNRRITGYTPMQLTGPAAGSSWLRTAADPGGTTVLGTLNNCGSGWTPWGTYLTCEENWNGYFAAPTSGATIAPGFEDQKAEILAGRSRYGISTTGFGYRWHEVDPRFDADQNPNEVNRFGWLVEIDPFQPGSTPLKRTAIGRFKHENAEVVVAPNGKVVVYTGDDERNEYLYKFVSDGVYDPSNPSSGRNILETGTLYVAKFEAGATAGDNAGTGEWIPLVHGTNGLTAANGFVDQADVLVHTRQAADLVGATMMDRPEWIAANPKRIGEVYLTLTNNSRRGSSATPTSNKSDGSTSAGSARPAVDEANPRPVNNWGHIVRWNEAGGDPTATTFTWDIFLLAGNPIAFAAGDPRAGSANITVDNLFNSPDGLQFDREGRLWIQTDGNFSNSGDYEGMGNNQMLVADPDTGEVRRFLVGPSGCEITGVTWSPDLKAMFINIQHPGELGSHPNRPAGYGDNDIARDPTAFSRFPNEADPTQPGAQPRPRSCTIVIRRADGGVVGT